MNMRDSRRSRYGWILSAFLLGCGLPEEDPTPELTAIVGTSLAALRDAESPPPAPKPPRANCPTCRGSGRVPSGDGLGTTECDRCEPPARAEPLPSVEQASPLAAPAPKPPVVAVPAPAICPPGGCPPTVPYVIRRR